jgi:hypothetical protein
MRPLGVVEVCWSSRVRRQLPPVVQPSIGGEATQRGGFGDGYSFGLAQRQPSLPFQLHVAGFALHVVQHADISQHDRRAHRARGLRFGELGPRVRPGRDLDHNAALAGLALGDKGLREAQLSGELGLGETCIAASFW